MPGIHEAHGLVFRGWRGATILAVLCVSAAALLAGAVCVQKVNAARQGARTLTRQRGATSTATEGHDGSSSLSTLSVSSGPPVNPVTYFVSPSGSDNNPGTQAEPFQTIQKAADIVNPGDNVVVGDGIYTGPSNPFCKNSPTIAVVCLWRGGTAGAPITFKSQNKWGAVIDGQNSYPVGFTVNGGGDIIGNFVIQDFDIRNMVDTGDAGGAAGIEFFFHGHDSVVAGNNIHDIGRINTPTCNGQVGIYLDVDNVTIERNSIHDIGRTSPAGVGCTGPGTLDTGHDHGIYLSAGNSTIVRNNLLYDITRGWGVQIFPTTRSNVQIVNNTFGGPGNLTQPGHIVIWAAGDMCSNCDISNNIFNGGSGGFIHTQATVHLPGTTIRNNLTTLSSVFDVQPGGAPTVTGNLLNTNPLFIGGPNFRLQNGSPAIDAGVNIAGVVNDFDGAPRPFGTTTDIGAFEWLSASPTPSPSPATVTVSLPQVISPAAASITVPVTVSNLTGLGVRAYDLQVTFNPAVLQPDVSPYDRNATLSSAMTVTANTTNAGHLILSGFQPNDVTGAGTLIKLRFNVVGGPGTSTTLAFANYTDPTAILHPGFLFNSGNPQAITTNGLVMVNAPPTITASVTARQAGSPASDSTIATVNDVNTGPASVVNTVNGSSSASLNGVTISNIVNSNGNVTASIAAACGATDASFTLTATDELGAAATATLNVTVSANTPPTLSYASALVPTGGSTTVTPTSGPIDNGSVSSIVIHSTGTYAGSISVNSSGVVSVSNAAPYGSHVITVRATDNCGAATDATLALSVTDVTPPDTSIVTSPANPTTSSSASFTFTGTDSDSGVASFECKLDGGAFASCSSPKTYNNLADGSHAFQVRAIDAVGNQDPSPASYTWTIDTVGPTTTIDSGPSDPTNSTSASFTFSANDAASAVASFECRLDNAAFAACTSPFSLSGLSARAHTFRVRAIDALGNVGADAVFPWTINSAPTITPTAVTSHAGSPATNSAIATVNDVESGAGGVSVTVNGGVSATVNGVTVSNIVNTGGNVTADVSAACGATAASFTLTATDGGGTTALATLNVTVSANTAPVLSYANAQSVGFGGSLNVSPTTSSDNGSITNYTVQSVVPALTTAPTVNASGVVSIINAAPAGDHVVTIRATDNCGATTDAQFTLTVGTAPAFSINDVSHFEGNSGTTSYTFTISKSGSTGANAQVAYATIDGTATSPSDFTAIPTTTLTFLPAEITKQITVLVNGDTVLEPDETFTVHLSNAINASISDADGTGTILNDELASISGRALYRDATTPGKNVIMTLTAPAFVTRTTTTDGSGNFTFSGLPPGNDYTLTPAKTGDVTGIESFDASFVARYVVGLEFPSPSQRIAGDTDGDGGLSSFDASLIARRVVGLPDTGLVGVWRFVPASRFYPALGANQTSQDFTAILIGDTSGNWLPSLANPDFGQSETAGTMQRANLPVTGPGVGAASLQLPTIHAANGDIIEIPIDVSDLTGLGVRSFDLELSFDPAVLQPCNPSLCGPGGDAFQSEGTLSHGMVLTPNANYGGHLIVSAFQATDLSGTGALLYLRFKVTGALGQSTLLKLSDHTDPNNIFHPGFRFNAGSPAVNSADGSVIVGAEAATGSISGHLSESDGTPVVGAAIKMAGSQNRLTVTDADGNYTFNDVPVTGSYSLSPSRANFSFSPGTRTFSRVDLHTDATFIAQFTGERNNPLDTTEFFVRQQYVDFLAREPDEPGFNFWVNNIESCGADVQCREVRRIDTSAAFFLSIEFQETGYLVYRTYRTAFGNIVNSPVPVSLSDLRPDTLQISRGVVVNQSGWEALLNSNKDAYFVDFVQRNRFRSNYPDTMAPAAFVDGLFGNAGFIPTEVERTAALSEFGTANTIADVAARARALRRVVGSPTLVDQDFDRAFVLMEYVGYLRRDPNALPDGDFAGYQFWLNKLEAFHGNYINAEMVKAFLTSFEYRGRFPR